MLKSQNPCSPFAKALREAARRDTDHTEAAYTTGQVVDDVTRRIALAHERQWTQDRYAVY
jgi:hypothetical protein